MAHDASTAEPREWVVRPTNGSDVGPVSTAQIAQAHALGRLGAGTMVRHVNAPAWEDVGAFMARTCPQQDELTGTTQVAVPALPRPAAPPRRPGADDTAPRPALRGTVLGSLFDFGFTTFLTVRIVGVLYALVLVVAAGTLLACEYFGVMVFLGALRLSQEGGDVPAYVLPAGAMLVIAGPLGAAFTVILGRVVAEFVVVTFRISETLTKIEARTR